MMNHNFLKRLLDRYPITVPVKGGAESWSADCIVLTSNVDLETWYPGLPLSDFNALKRRIEIFQFPGDKKKAIEWLRCRETSNGFSTHEAGARIYGGRSGCRDRIGRRRNRAHQDLGRVRRPDQAGDGK